MQFDLKIVGGTVVDGSGRPAYAGDVGIRDGRIAALGRVDGAARETVDATGRAVAPGFVDVHTHYDAQVLWDPKLTISPWHGVTTVVMGNCGFGVAPTRPADRARMMRTLEKVEGMSFQALEAGLGDDWGFESFPEYLDVVERGGSAVNLGVLLGHTPLRTWRMGADAVSRAATDDEIRDMAALAAEAAEAGALGFATSHASTHHGYGGNPVPSRLASLAEIGALTAAVASRGRPLLQATIGKTLFLDEFAELAERHGVTVTWTALLSGLAGPGSHRRHLARTAELMDGRGLNVVPQVSCRPLNFEFHFDEPFPFEMRPLFQPTMKTDRAGRAALYRDPAFRAAFKADSAGQTGRNPLAGWLERAVITVAPERPELAERPLAAVAAELGVDPIDFALDLSLATDLTARFRFPVFNYDETEVAELLDDPHVVVALSDAGAHASQLCDACYATFLLGHWVREKRALSLERAVHMLTQRPAELFGIADRGLLAEGRPADVVVFDPATVGAGPVRRVYDLPAGADRLVADAFGIELVLVNGVPVRRDGADVATGPGRPPGRLLRGGRAA